MAPVEILKALYQAVQARPRPEEVADLVLQALDDQLTSPERQTLDQAARHSYRRLGRGYSSMASEFFRATTGVGQQLKTAATLFIAEADRGPVLTLAQSLDPAQVLEFVRAVGALVGKRVGANDFRTDRLLPKAERRQRGLYKNARWINKRWRLLKTIEVKLARHAWNEKKYAATRTGKGGLAWTLTEAQLTADLNTACLAAYLAARMAKRSIFTNTKQERAYDYIADLLYRRCEASETTRWDVLALLMPDARVLQQLTEVQKGALLGRWWEELAGLGEMLAKLWASFEPVPNRVGMVVQRGQDSTTWNQTALAWNEVRTHWIAVLHALGYEGMLTDFCPGKVMRLMAADVARWHKLSGGDVHPDTKVWAELAAPWEVIRGNQRCGRAEVEAACDQHGVTRQGWTGLRPDRQPVPFTPTPELVHGVAVTSPTLALLLRKAGVFSGKGLKGEVPDVDVVRDELGFALGARPEMKERIERQ